MARVERRFGGLASPLVRLAYFIFEIIAFIMLAIAALIAFYDFIAFLFERGFDYTEVLPRILLIFVFIDLMRVIVHSVTERRFRMDILFEAITIAVARDLISALAFVEKEFEPMRIMVMSGLLALVVTLWYFARRAELAASCTCK